MTFNINVDEREKVMQAILDQSPFDPDGASESVRNIWDRYQNVVELFPDVLKGDALVYFVDWLLERVFLVEIGTTDQDMALEIAPGSRSGVSGTMLLRRTICSAGCLPESESN